MSKPPLIVVNDDDDLSSPLNPDVVVEFAPDDSPSDDAGTCHICGKSGFKRLNAHLTKAHGEGTAPSATGRKAKKSLEDDLATMLGALAMAVSLFDQHDGMVIGTNGPNVARAWSNLALRNASVDRVLRSMMGGVSYGEVIMATAGMLLPILAHHNLLPAPMAAILTPTEPYADSPGG